MKAAALLLLPLAACQAASAPPGDPVACAPAGQPLRPDCTVSRAGNGIIVHHRDGSFRRLTRTADGLESADGAEPVRSAPGPDGTDVTIGGTTYRLPRPTL